MTIMRKLAAALLVPAIVGLAACDRGKETPSAGPKDPIPGPAGAVAPGGNNPPGGAVSPPGKTAAEQPDAGMAGKAAESKMPPEGSGSGKSVQESSAHGSTQAEDKGVKK
jgi:hypothetical protein